MKTYEVEVEIKKYRTFYVTASSKSDAEYEAYDRAQDIYDEEEIAVTNIVECEPDDDIEKYRD